jgi:AcrR family transcriptional regulator
MGQAMARKKIAPERQKEIIAGLYKCLANAGHEQVSVKDIARAANLSRGVIHYYFDSKKDIMLALIEDFIGRNESLFQDIIEQIEPAWERLRAFISLSVERLVLDPEATMFFLNIYQMAMTDADIRAGAKSSYLHFRKAISNIVEYGTSRGEFVEVDPERFAFYLVGCLEGMWLQVSMDPELYDRETIENILCEKTRLQLMRIERVVE